jgi:hypothetical protein
MVNGTNSDKSITIAINDRQSPNQRKKLSPSKKRKSVKVEQLVRKQRLKNNGGK